MDEMFKGRRCHKINGIYIYVLYDYIRYDYIYKSMVHLEAPVKDF